MANITCKSPLKGIQHFQLMLPVTNSHLNSEVADKEQSPVATRDIFFLSSTNCINHTPQIHPLQK